MRCKNCEFFEKQRGDSVDERWGKCDCLIFQEVHQGDFISPRTLFIGRGGFDVHQDFGCIGFRRKDEV